MYLENEKNKTEWNYILLKTVYQKMMSGQLCATVEVNQCVLHLTITFVHYV